ncbi:MAG TPA: tetratricopeptide repeat protein [Pyrinomonadaceae bacterium]|nr:tetratricopeptide repeat protein [Pyrinomonadaceae bacterium]
MFYPTAGLRVPRLTTNYLPALLLVLVSALPSSNVLAQGGRDSTGTGGGNRIQGRIYFPSGRRTDHPTVKVTLESTSSERLSVIADLNGSFTFSSMAPGSYHITVDAGNEYELARESVLIEQTSVRTRSLAGEDMGRINTPRTFNVMVNLRLKTGYAASRAGVVSANQPNVPPRALEAYQRSMEASRAKDDKKAVEELKRALAEFPTFALAINELGVQYLKLGQVNKAAEVLSDGVKASPEDFHLRLNYGVALLNQKKFAQAEEQLRVAVSKNNSSPTAHMYLGIVLAVQRKLDEAHKELELAINSRSTEVAMAHRYLGGVYLERRDYKRAADQLETYLKLSPKAADSELLQQKIKELRGKT